MTAQEKKRYHHGDLRRVILDTAMTMLAEPAGVNFTLRAVARRAGVSHSAPYKHFEDKAALLTEMALVGFDQLTAALDNSVQVAPEGFRSKFFAAAAAYIDFARQNPSLYRLMFGGEFGTISAHLDPRALKTFDFAVKLIEQGQQEGQVRERPLKGQATACWAQIHGLTMLELNSLLQPEKVGENVIEQAIVALHEGLNI
ncbi:TetR family transcriptional regulator [Marivivens niveibacter]|uniref:TetR family transcriptional regulator n=1 Tax=Marivivens niveibacter TaxID=1930667 RepID=A0A251WW15_9RHOB|nr:TetR/AcrR family transcriptional regulator [Marivivens niveibacter]OUD08572.1 TetR family transcriptional regulator [Marivivens niveibacter]